jgi:hypothetical protein
MKSTAKAITLSRSIKEKLQFRGFTCVESFDTNGWPKLTINTDEASITITGQDAVSKDVFGNDLVSFAPHNCAFASRNDAMSTLKVSKIMLEIAKTGIEKTAIHVHATVLATAEASAPVEVLTADVQWPTKGV